MAEPLFATGNTPPHVVPDIAGVADPATMAGRGRLDGFDDVDGVDGARPIDDEPAGRASRFMAQAADELGSVSLVIPTKNEARNIGWVLEHMPDCVDEVILVDSSTDATRTMAIALRPDIRVVESAEPGKGNALRTGFAASTGDIIVMIDADGSMSPSEIPHYLHFLANGFDFVKGSRFVAGGGSLDITRLRRTGNRMLMRVANSLYDTNLTDLCYGFCAFHRHFLDHLDLTADGFEIETQMTVHAVQAGLRIAEVPSLELPRRSGQSNLRTMRDGRRVLSTLVREHRSGLSGRLVQAGRRSLEATSTP